MGGNGGQTNKPENYSFNQDKKFYRKIRLILALLHNNI
jgi:hypothetical protein